MAPINRCPDWGLRILLCINWVVGTNLSDFDAWGSIPVLYARMQADPNLPRRRKRYRNGRHSFLQFRHPPLFVGTLWRSVRNSFGFRPTERIVHPPNELADRLKFILWGFLRGIPLFYVTLAHYFGQFAR